MKLEVFFRWVTAILITGAAISELTRQSKVMTGLAQLGYPPTLVWILGPARSVRGRRASSASAHRPRPRRLARPVDQPCGRERLARARADSTLARRGGRSDLPRLDQHRSPAP